jgi:hypothetical protein
MGYRAPDATAPGARRALGSCLPRPPTRARACCRDDALGERQPGRAACAAPRGCQSRQLERGDRRGTTANPPPRAPYRRWARARVSARLSHVVRSTSTGAQPGDSRRVCRAANHKEVRILERRGVRVGHPRGPGLQVRIPRHACAGARKRKYPLVYSVDWSCSGIRPMSARKWSWPWSSIAAQTAPIAGSGSPLAPASFRKANAALR